MKPWYLPMEVCINEGTPIAGWFTMQKPIYKWMIWGYPHVRNPPMLLEPNYLNMSKLSAVGSTIFSPFPCLSVHHTCVRSSARSCSRAHGTDPPPLPRTKQSRATKSGSFLFGFVSTKGRCQMTSKSAKLSASSARLQVLMAPQSQASTEEFHVQLDCLNSLWMINYCSL